MERLFIYGTLREPKIRFKLTGKKFSSVQTLLKGYKTSEVKQENIAYPNIEYTGNNSDIIEGEIIEVDRNDLKIFDDYEGEEYNRKMVELENGIKSWVYCSSVNKKNDV